MHSPQFTKIFARRVAFDQRTRTGSESTIRKDHETQSCFANVVSATTVANNSTIAICDFRGSIYQKAFDQLHDQTVMELDPFWTEPRLSTAVRRARLAVRLAAVSEQDVVRHLRLALKDGSWRAFVNQPLPLLQRQDDRWIQHCLVDLGVLSLGERPQESAPDLSPELWCAEHQFPLSAFPLDQEEEDENQEWHQSLPKSPSCEKAWSWGACSLNHRFHELST